MSERRLAIAALASIGLVGVNSLKRYQETRKLRAAVAVAFQVHDFPRVLKLALPIGHHAQSVFHVRRLRRTLARIVRYQLRQTQTPLCHVALRQMGETRHLIL